jgi:hypothetical protein
VCIAAVFEFLGALLLGGQVTKTIAGGIAKTSTFAKAPQLFMYGMLTAETGAMIWILLATYMELPVSTTHSIIGGIIGFARECGCCQGRLMVLATATAGQLGLSRLSELVYQQLPVDKSYCGKGDIIGFACVIMRRGWLADARQPWCAASCNSFTTMVSPTDLPRLCSALLLQLCLVAAMLSSGMSQRLTSRTVS